MEVTFFDKIRLVLSLYTVAPRLPHLGKVATLLLKPLDATRFTEFAYVHTYIREKKLHGMKVLDISSPHLLAYWLSKENSVIKTNIDEWERNFIKESPNLTFEIADATSLAYETNSFDFVYSVSVIEHIYQGYAKAAQEMLRVARPGGLVYLTFPVCASHREEWTATPAYPDQKSREGEYFFQYRLGPHDIEEMLAVLPEAEIVRRDIFWERIAGTYEKMIQRVKASSGNAYLDFIKNIFVTWYYGLTMFKNVPTDEFLPSSRFGNMHLLLRKKQL